MRVPFFLGLLILSVPIVQAQNAAVETLPPLLQSRVVDSDPLMDFRTQNVPQGRVDRDTGVLRAAYRLAPTVPLRATHEATARAYLDAEAERFGWATADDLLLVREIDGHYSAHLTFQQTFGGIPVHNRFVKVSMGSDGHPSMVLSGYAPHLRDAGHVRLQPLIDASDAVLRAQQATLAQRVSTPELVVYPSTPPRLAWSMTVSPDGSVAEWEVLMDADTGEILYLMNQVAHMGTPSPVPAGSALSAPAEPAAIPAARAVVDGTGLVFDPDPLTSAGVPYGGAYVDNDDADVEELNAERKEVVLRDITLGADGLYRLIGPYVEITGEEINVAESVMSDPPPAEADPNAFRYGRGNDFFEAVMVYYHIDQNQRYIQSLDVGYPIAEYPIRANPHGMASDVTYSQYSPSSRGISFGDWHIDDAEDADLILYHYGRAIVWDVLPQLWITGAGESRALHLGWASYWTGSYSRGLAEEGVVPTFQDWRILSNWAVNNDIWSHERLNEQGRYPEDTGCDSPPDPCFERRDGLLWATTMMEIYDDLGKRVTDRLHLASLAYLNPPSTFVDVAEALLQADEDLHGGENRNILTERLAARGYLRIPLRLSVSPSTVAEGTAVDVMVTATLDDGWLFANAQTVTVSVGASEDSALEGVDYAAVSDFTITIPGESSSATSTFTLDPTLDGIAEDSETVGLEGSMTIADPYGSEITITDSDANTALVLTVAPARLHENSGSSWVRFRASLNAAARPTDTPVEVSVTNGTATEGTDYSISVVPTPVMIPAGETSISDSLQITITDDDAVEGNETVVIGVSAPGVTDIVQDLVIIDDESAVRIDVLNVIANDDGDYTITATVRQNMGAPVRSVVLYYGDGVAFEETPMQSLGSLYRAELMAPDEGGILYYYVVATNGDGLTARYPPDERYWDISDYIEDSRLVFLDFENDDAGDKSTAGHYVAYRGDVPTFAEGALALDGLDDHLEILGSSLGASEEFALEIMFNADDFDAGTLDTGGGYLVAKPAGCSTCWGESMFSLLWGDGSGNSDTYVAARFWNSEFESRQVELEVPLPLASGQWYHAILEVQKEGAEQRAVLQLRDRSGQLYGEDVAVLPASPTISRHPIFVGHIGDRGFFDGRIDNVAFYNYAHFDLPLTNVEDAGNLPEGYVLEQNYPNPFNPVTTIRYDLAAVGHVRLEVSDLLGRRVTVLADEVQQAGTQEVRFDAGDLPSGMYLYRLRVEDFVSVKKMVLLK